MNRAKSACSMMYVLVISISATCNPARLIPLLRIKYRFQLIHLPCPRAYQDDCLQERPPHHGRVCRITNVSKADFPFPEILLLASDVAHNVDKLSHLQFDGAQVLALSHVIVVGSMLSNIEFQFHFKVLRTVQRVRLVDVCTYQVLAIVVCREHKLALSRHGLVDHDLLAVDVMLPIPGARGGDNEHDDVLGIPRNLVVAHDEHIMGDVFNEASWNVLGEEEVVAVDDRQELRCQQEQKPSG
mmetsp:Transcript_23007/g.46197  ORF Transcript_23007/g.46197 Transcript_23007/m.46197 type:complete len:242 (+) Transcript_23007:51-776(+)